MLRESSGHSNIQTETTQSSPPNLSRILRFHRNLAFGVFALHRISATRRLLGHSKLNRRLQPLHEANLGRMVSCCPAVCHNSFHGGNTVFGCSQQHLSHCDLGALPSTRLVNLYRAVSNKSRLARFSPLWLYLSAAKQQQAGQPLGEVRLRGSPRIRQRWLSLKRRPAPRLDRRLSDIARQTTA